MLGVWKKLLRVNLSRGEIKIEDIPEEYFIKFIGGSGLATKYLFDEVLSGTEPLSKENKIIFGTGPFQGFPFVGGAKWAVVSKSPLTKTFAISTAGAKWGFNLKKAGYDLLIIEGKSEKPVYLWINDDRVEILQAEHIWGNDAIKTAYLVKKDLMEEKKSEISVVTIGQAGEKLVRIACLVADDHSFAGRCGLGAILGAKRLKAIAVKGTKNVIVADKKRIQELNKKYFQKISKKSKETGFDMHGTSSIVIPSEEVGDLPIKYWNEEVWSSGAKKIGAPNITEELKWKPWACLFCPVRCHRKVEFEYRNEKIVGAGAEYETLGMLGSNCLVDDIGVISKANDLCNRLGIDTISAGAFVGFTMECYEKGLLSDDDLNGWKANWGDGDFLIHFIKQIGNKEGFGAVFAEGIRPAASKIGKQANELIVEVKNLDFPAHDPRSYFSLAINYATSIRGACHLRGAPHCAESGALLLPEVGLMEPPERFNMRDQAMVTALMQDFAALVDSLVICLYMPIHSFSLTDISYSIKAITGLDITPHELMHCGERIVTLQRLINVDDGIDRKDDRLPPKMFIPAKEGFRKGKIPEPFEKTLLEYYEFRGWDKAGIPKKKKIVELGVEKNDDS